MTANDLPTAGFIDQHMQHLRALIGQLVPPAPPATGTVVLYSVQKLAQVLEVHPDTVRAWLKKGKKGRLGQRITLQAYKFTSEGGGARPALLAYERGEDFDLASLPAPVLVLPAELQPAPLPKLESPDTPPAVLRVA